MIDWLAQHGPSLATLFFFVTFIGIALWAFAPANKRRMEEDATIPFKE